MRSSAAGERAGAQASPGRAALGRRRLLGGVLALALLALGSWHGLRAEPSADAARTLIQTVGDEVLTVLRDASLGDRDKVERLVALLNGPIDLDLVARLILGRHWRSASEEQRAEYLELFRAFALHTLASRLDVYGGQEFEITGAKVVGRNDALVSTQILSQGPPLGVDWRVRELDDNSLVAIDVIVEGVSLIVTQRSEFGAVVERQGMDGLLAELRRRAESRA
ncbi:MAG: putative toluene tolerance transporter [Geminicoccaceae bacterium]|jgi:phospholipid transport system substrate-binding protein|nr:putative toluene tolerance transporter [Geminicoccaceae bacterium]